MPRERLLRDVVEERQGLLERRREIVELAQREARGFTDAERAELERNAAGVSLLEAEERDVTAAEARMAAEAERQRRQGTGGSGAQGGNGVTLVRAINELVDGRGFSPEVEAIHAEGLAIMQSRGLGGTGQGTGGQRLCIPVGNRRERVQLRNQFMATGPDGYGSDLVQTDFFQILPALRDALVLTRAGARLLTGLRGDVNIPAYTGSQSFWEGEIDPVPDGGGKFVHKTLRPRRLGSKVLISRQMLLQDELSMDAVIRQDLVESIRNKVQSTILGAGTHSDTVPDGLFTGLPTDATELSWKALIDLKTKCATANALTDGASFITHPAVVGWMEQVAQQSTGTSPATMLNFIMNGDNSRVGGYGIHQTNGMASLTPQGGTPQYGLAFGNWGDLYIGQWGAIELTVDTITLADQGNVRIIVNSFWDAVVVRDVSVAKVWVNLPGVSVPAGKRVTV
jgi:HK97 family phage major capsid protein